MSIARRGSLKSKSAAQAPLMSIATLTNRPKSGLSRSYTRIMLKIVFAFLSCLFTLSGQTSSVLTGRILDATGAILPDSKIVARNSERGIRREVVSSADGRFVFAGLPPGDWQLRVERTGFRTLVRSGVHLSVGETASVDLQMQLGAVDQEVNVQADASQVNTSTSELSYLVSDRTMHDLPLNGRNYTDFVLLQPGVVAYSQRDGGSVVAHGLGTSINGQDPRSNVYLLDGTLMNDFTNGPAGSAANTVLGLETIREYRVATNGYSAEYGRNSGGQISVLSKAGGNAFHGAVYEYFRNDHFDARNFFDPRQIPKFTRNQFGAVLGGPIKRDKTFFFVGFESLREHSGKTIISAVPDSNARNGLLPVPGSSAFTTVAINPNVLPFLNEIPRANAPGAGGGLGNYIWNFNQTTVQDFVSGRLDHNFSARNQIFGRYTYDNANQFLPTDFPQFPRSFLSTNQFATIEFRSVLSPTVLNTARGGFSRTHIGQDVQANTTQNLAPFIPGRGQLGYIDIGGMPRFGTQSSAFLRLTQNVFSFTDDLTWVRGKHFLKAGALIERYQDNEYNGTFSLGGYTFANLQGFLQGTPTRFLGITPNGALDRYWRFTEFGFYAQDDWRVAARLTLNIGLRYEFTTLPVDIYGRDSALLNIYTDAAATPGKLFKNPTHKNISPRFGFAWDVFGNGRTALRGGYGWYFNTNNQQNLIVTITNPPATPRVSISNPTFPNPIFERGLGNTIRPVDYNIKNPNVHQWNLSLQRALPWDFVVTAGYAGSRGVHLLRSGDVNTEIPTKLADGTYFFPATGVRQNPAWTVIELKRSDGNSWYNSGILEIRKRFSKGFSAQSSYTFSRNIDTTQASTFFSDGTNDTTSAFPEYPGFSTNKGLSDYHAKHNWVVNLTYELPSVKSHSATTWLIRDWQASVISSVRSGNPVSLFVANNWSRSRWQPSIGPGLGLDRPSIAPGRTAENAVIGSPNGWFDPTAFVLSPQGTLGNLGRNVLIGPDLRDVDFSLSKRNKLSFLSDHADLQFRVEAFNLMNHPNFALNPPSLLAFTGNSANETALAGLGKVRPPTVTSARQIQFGLRLSF